MLDLTKFVYICFGSNLAFLTCGLEKFLWWYRQYQPHDHFVEEIVTKCESYILVKKIVIFILKKITVYCIDGRW